MSYACYVIHVSNHHSYHQILHYSPLSRLQQQQQSQLQHWGNVQHQQQSVVRPPWTHSADVLRGAPTSGRLSISTQINLSTNQYLSNIKPYSFSDSIVLDENPFQEQANQEPPTQSSKLDTPQWQWQWIYFQFTTYIIHLHIIWQF